MSSNLWTTSIRVHLEDGTTRCVEADGGILELVNTEQAEIEGGGAVGDHHTRGHGE